MVNNNSSTMDIALTKVQDSLLKANSARSSGIREETKSNQEKKKKSKKLELS